VLYSARGAPRGTRAIRRPVRSALMMGQGTTAHQNAPLLGPRAFRFPSGPASTPNTFRVRSDQVPHQNAWPGSDGPRGHASCRSFPLPRRLVTGRGQGMPGVVQLMAAQHLRSPTMTRQGNTECGGHTSGALCADGAKEFALLGKLWRRQENSGTECLHHRIHQANR